MPRLCLSLLLSLVIASSASAVPTVVPNAYETFAGDTNNRAPFLVYEGMRYQQVFAASQFSDAMSIGQIALRNYSGIEAKPFTATIPSIQIWLSTTAANPGDLSATFADNIGADNAQVYTGSLTLSSTNAAGPGGTHVFDVLINLRTPFYYDPNRGNLLLDVKNISGASANVTLGIYFDAASADFRADSISKVFGPEGNPDATSGTPVFAGLIVQFDIVPEPGAGLLMIVGLLGLTGWCRATTSAN